MIPDISQFIFSLHALPPEWLEGGMFLFCAGMILLLLRLFGEIGLYLYVAVAVIAGNVQVLKAVQFSFYSSPVALGTIIFASIFLASDILTEYYGKKKAQRAVWLGFWAALLINGYMLITLAMRPLSVFSEGVLMRYIDSHEAMAVLFLPAPAIFFASLISYVISQFSDIYIFQAVKRITHEKWLWLRGNLAAFLSSILDNVVFSLLAWVILTSTPVDSHTLIYTYILGTLAFRMLASITNTPFLYWAKWCLPRKSDQ